MIKQIIFILILIPFGIVNAQPTKILWIGNSYVTTNDLPFLVYKLALSNGDTIIYDNASPGGSNLAQHSTNSTTLSKINAQNWDYVVLQEQSQMPSFSPSQVQTDTYPYAALLNDLILANDSCTETVFYMTWGRKYGDASNCAIYPPVCTFDGMQARLRQSYVEMADDNQALVSPVGQAFKYARLADSTINLYSIDNSHPSLAGTYLAACTFYATIFETSPVGLSYTAGLNATQAAFLQQIAYQTVFDSLSVWNINEFEPQASFNIASLGGSIYQYQFTNTAINSSNFSWNFGDGNGSTIINPVHTFLGNGTYTITLTASDGCQSDTFQETINIGPLSSIQELNNNEINVTLQEQNISITQNQSNLNFLQITVFDVLGKVIYHNNFNNQKLVLNTATWNKGLFFVQCSNKQQVITKKIIIE